MKHLFALSILFTCFLAQAQDAQKFQDKLNKDYRNPAKSPLPKDELANFQTLPFFEIDSIYRIIAKFTRTPNEKSFQMPTTTNRKPIYVKYGEVHFDLKGKSFSLDVFQNVALRSSEEYKDYLFLPFFDNTNGLETYGGGRFLDLKIPKVDSVMLLDFNKAYNPYCAYNKRYSCPIVPVGNVIDASIKAGVMLMDDWHLLKLKQKGFRARFPSPPKFTELESKVGEYQDIDRFRFYGTFEIDSNFVFQVEVKSFKNSTCPQPDNNFYNDCFKDILTEKLRETKGALMFIQRVSINGHDAYEFKILAQGKTFSKYKVVLIGNKAYVASVATMWEARYNHNLKRFLDSFQVF